MDRYGKTTGVEAIAKMIDIAAKNQRVQVTRDLHGSALYNDDPEWSIDAVLYCDDPENPHDPDTYWTLSVGHDGTNPWMGASLSFRTKHVREISYANTRPDLIIR